MCSRSRSASLKLTGLLVEPQPWPWSPIKHTSMVPKRALSVATEAYVSELERRAPASGARFSAARDIVRGTYGEKIEVPEACLWASKTRSGLRSASFRNHRRVFDGTPGPGLRLYACKLQRCAGALDQGPEKHTTPKEYVSETGFDVLPAVSGRRATSHD